jgi:signal transduction histidine kinase
VPAGREPATLLLPADALPVRADAQKLAQAVRNILSNAYKYSPDGGPVTIALRRDGAGAPARAGLQVADSGIGMTPEQVARVCERFYRADASGNIPGTGLGMSIVKEIVALHGGGLDIASTAGVGSTVSLWLPIAEDAVVEAARAEQPLAAETST